MADRRANWIYLFHGEDDLSSQEAVQGLIARMKDSPVWELNVAVFDGERVDPTELINTCQTLPFMADKRLVVVNNLLSRLVGAAPERDEVPPGRAPRSAKKAALEELLAFLPSVPPFCRLVLVENQLVPERDPVLKAIQAMGGFVKAHRLEEWNLPGWIRDRARKQGCKMSSEAADELAAAVGPNARLLNGEIIKLATYCGDRMVSSQDVRLLVADARKANVFAMVDALGQRRAEDALRELRKLLAEGDHPLRVTAMVVRQFRLLIQVRELSEAGATPEEIARKMGVSLRNAGSLQRQARNFSLGQLEAIYRRLLDFDLQVKTGLVEPESALELLILELLRVA